MKIDKRLHLVVPIFEDDPKDPRNPRVVAQVHSTPLARETVERFALVLAKTWGTMINNGLGISAGPGMALMLLKAHAQEMQSWDGPEGIQTGLVEEMRRLSLVAVPGPGGWQSVPLPVAVAQGFISEDDQQEVENAICFFTCASAVLSRALRAPLLASAAELWGAQILSLNSTEWMASLMKSKGTASSGEKSLAPVSAGSGAANAQVDGKPASVPH